MRENLEMLNLCVNPMLGLQLLRGAAAAGTGGGGPGAVGGSAGLSVCLPRLRNVFIQLGAGVMGSSWRCVRRSGCVCMRVVCWWRCIDDDALKQDVRSFPALLLPSFDPCTALGSLVSLRLYSYRPLERELI